MVTWSFRVLVLAGPPLAFALTRAIGHALAARREEERHGRETGRIVRNPHGGYDEIREPADRAALPSAGSPGPAAARRGSVAARHPALHGPDLLAGPVSGSDRGSPGRSWRPDAMDTSILIAVRHARHDPDCPVHRHRPAVHRRPPGPGAATPGSPPASADARKRTSVAGRTARPREPGADDAAPAGYLYLPCTRIGSRGHPAQTRRWVQEVPIVKKTATLIYYTSDSWDRREAVVSPGCISREQFEADTRCREHCPRDAAGLVCAAHGRGHRHCVHVLAPGRRCYAPGGCGHRLPGRYPRRAVRTARVHVGALPARGRPLSRLPGRRDPGTRPPPRAGGPALLRHPPGRRRPPVSRGRPPSRTGRTARTAYQGTAPRHGRRPPRPRRHRRAVHPSAPPVPDRTRGRATVTRSPRRPLQARQRDARNR